MNSNRKQKAHSQCGQPCGHFVSLPSLRSGHVTDAYLASALRAFAQIHPIGRTSDVRQPLCALLQYNFEEM